MVHNYTSDVELEATPGCEIRSHEGRGEVIQSSVDRRSDQPDTASCCAIQPPVNILNGQKVQNIDVSNNKCGTVPFSSLSRYAQPQRLGDVSPRLAKTLS